MIERNFPRKLQFIRYIAFFYTMMQFHYFANKKQKILIVHHENVNKYFSKNTLQNLYQSKWIKFAG